MGEGLSRVPAYFRQHIPEILSPDGGNRRNSCYRAENQTRTLFRTPLSSRSSLAGAGHHPYVGARGSPYRRDGVTRATHFAEGESGVYEGKEKKEENVRGACRLGARRICVSARVLSRSVNVPHEDTM